MTLQLYTERQSQKEHCVILLSIQQLISVTTKWKDWPEAETLAYTLCPFQLFSRTSSSSGSDCCSVKEVTPPTSPQTAKTMWQSLVSMPFLAPSFCRQQGAGDGCRCSNYIKPSGRRLHSKVGSKWWAEGCLPDKRRGEVLPPSLQNSFTWDWKKDLVSTQ